MNKETGSEAKAVAARGAAEAAYGIAAQAATSEKTAESKNLKAETDAAYVATIEEAAATQATEKGVEEPEATTTKEAVDAACVAACEAYGAAMAADAEEQQQYGGIYGTGAAAAEATNATAEVTWTARALQERCSQHLRACEKRAAEACKCRDSRGRMDGSSQSEISQAVGPDYNGQP